MSEISLFLFVLPGCDACAQAKRWMSVFLKKNPGIEYEEVDITAIEWESEYVKAPESAPSYALVIDGGKPVTWTQRGLDPEELERWIYGR